MGSALGSDQSAPGFDPSVDQGSQIFFFRAGHCLHLCLEFHKVPVGIFIYLVLVVNNVSAVYALNFSCSFYKHLLIFLFPF